MPIALENMCIFVAYKIITETMDEEDKNDSILEKTFNFAEFTVPRFSDNQFKEHFRIFPSTYDLLLKQIRIANRDNFNSNQMGRPQIHFEKQVLITLWCLANIESFRSVADRFGITKSACWQVLYRTCFRILNANSLFGIIAFPTGNKVQSVIDGFQTTNGFPGVLGAIDGCHIRIKKPHESPNSYINRKGYASVSVLLQGICDNRKLFLDVYAGQPGSLNDARLFQKSSIYNRIRNGDVHFPNNSHLIGDLAYPLSTTLLVGFKDRGNLTRPQINFNCMLASVRVAIENAFGLLKARFRRLQFIETKRLDLISLLIVVSCILHNICTLNGDIIRFEGETENGHVNNEVINEAPAQAAIEKRTDIANLLYLRNN